MKDVFEELEAEVDQNVVDRKHDEIERKNLLIAHDNLIADCLSKEVFYVATNYELNVSRFTEMHDALVWNLKLSFLIYLKYQNLKESFGNNPSTPARDTPDFDSVFVIGKMKASLQGKDNVIKKLKTQISHLQETRSEADRTLDFRALDFQITQLTEKVTVLQEQNELFRAENAKIKQHYKELYDSIKITRAKHIEQTTALTTENENLKAQIQTKMKSVTKDHVKPTVLAPGKYAIDVEPIPPRNRNNREVHLDYLRHLKESVETLYEIVEEAKVERPLDRKKQVTFKEQCDTSNSNTHIHVGQLNTQQTNVPMPPSTGVNYYTNASGSQPRSNTKKNKISPAKGVNKKKVEEHPKTNKSNLRTMNRVDSSSSSKRIIINSNPDYVWQTFKQVWKPKQVRQVWKPTGKVLTSVGHQWRPTGRIFTLGEQCPLTRLTAPKVVIQIILWYLDSGCSKHMTRDRSQLRNFMKEFIGIVKFGNDHFGAIMGYGDYVIGDSVISRAEVVETACYTQNRSLIHTHYDKTPYELVHDKKPDLTFFCVVGALCYPTNDTEDLGKLQPTADIGIFVGYAPSKKGYRIYNKRTRRIMETIHVQFDELTKHMAPVQLSLGPAPTFLMPRQISLGLVPNPVPAAPYVPPTNKELEILFQPMFDEYMEPPRVERSVSPAPAVSVPVNSTGVAADSTVMEDNPFTPVDNHPFINVFAPEPSSKASSSRDLSSAESPYVSQTLHYLGKWSKDHPLDNIIGNPSWPVSTRKQLATDALWCLYNPVLSKVETKNFKSAITEDCWFQAMQDEIHEFDRLQVWELVPQPDCVMIIALKWIY
ncbi:retrovirus-related pol polyprotein from transposon TNT 1-94 [Tanacetum coccineum]|uniref:Retrovirus-related pol polyprotein from transposon TNT 1-94 n=1 Tax=Tanacetum coccineum TaxID=301880 RepID=A0ABQ4Z767_9ASTR